MLKSELLTNRAGGNVAGDIDVACGPVEAGLLELAYCFVASVVSCKATVTGANVVYVLGCNCEVALWC